MTAIVCVSRNWGIGRDGALLFHISADHRRFRAMTLGKTVLLGHKTLETFPGGRPLKGRRNIVLSRRDLQIDGAEVAHSFDEAAALGGDDAIVIGGASVYMALLDRCDRVYVTMVDAAPEADSFSPGWTTIPTGASNTKAKSSRKRGFASATSTMSASELLKRGLQTAVWRPLFFFQPQGFIRPSR